MLQKDKNIGDLLIDLGVINAGDLKEGLKLQKKTGLRLGEALIKLGKLTRDQMEWVLSKQLDIPFVIVEDINLDPALVDKFPSDLLLKNRILPLYETEDEIAVATDDPVNMSVIDLGESSSGKKIRLSSGNGEKIAEILRQYFKKDGVPTLISSLRDITLKISNTSFYRIDFILSGYHCNINIFGCGLLKNIAAHNESFEKEDIFRAFNSLDIPFLYDEQSNESLRVLSVYPITNKVSNLNYPLVTGTFGLFLPDEISFTDAQVSRVPLLLHSDKPVSGYPFISLSNEFLNHKKIIFTIDSAPDNFSNYFVHMSAPKKCKACNGTGCEICSGLGYAFKVLGGVYSSDEIKNILSKG